MALRSFEKVREFQAALLERMCRLQRDINFLYDLKDADSEVILRKEAEIAKLFAKLRRVRDYGKDQVRLKRVR